MNVFITRRIPQVAIDMLSSKYDVEVYEENKIIPRDELLERVEGVDAVLSLLTDQIDEEFLEAAGENLKIVANYAVGFDNFDVEAMKSAGVIGTNTPGALTDAVAEFTISLLLSLSKRIVEADKFVRAGKFDGWSPMLLLGSQLKGKTLGLVGSGRIGLEVAKMAYHGFGMNIIYNDIVQNAEIESDTKAELVELDTLMSTADFVSIHVPLLESTKHLIDGEKLALMKGDAYIINTSRGPVIEEEALVEALHNGEIKGAALDVYEFEPVLSQGLKELENVILTPHIASATTEARNEMAKIAAENIIEVLEGRSAKTEVT